MEEATETLPGLADGTPACVVRHRYARVNGVRLHYVEADPHSGRENQNARVVLTLHGFPEFWYSWRYQFPALAASRFRVLAPDLRGYNDSDKPRGIEMYRLDALTADVAGLIREAGARQACIVGHDWGGVIAWALAMERPELVERLVILNAPHPAVFLREVRTPGQMLRSWYTLFFQLPLLPELLCRAADYRWLDRTFRREPVRQGAFTDEDIRRYKKALDQPGALTAALNYYRAAFRYRGRSRTRFRPITAPTLLIWGERDRYLGPRLTEGLETWVPGLRIERLADASHWVQCDAPEPVNRAIVAFLKADKT